MNSNKRARRFLGINVFLLGAALLSILTACSSGSSNSGAADIEDVRDPLTDVVPDARVYVSSPDAKGRVLVVSSESFSPGSGTVVGTNLTKFDTIVHAGDAAAENCLEDSALAHEDGSFFSLSLCADIGDAIGLSLFSEGVELQDLGQYTVPATSQETCDANERAFTVTNSSSEEIWLGVTSGTLSCLQDSDCPTAATGSCVGANAGAGVAGYCGCATATECGSVAQCNTNNNQCYWNPPALSVGQMKLAPLDGQSLLCFPAPEVGKNIQWSGNMFARTGCDASGTGCATADCGSEPNKNCPTGTGGNPPNTLLEFTLSNQTIAPIPGSDFYDISIINGVNLAASFEPTEGTFIADISDPYVCAGAGSTTQTGALSACTWEVKPEVDSVDYSSLLRNVAPAAVTSEGGHCPSGSTANALGYCECESDSECSAGGQLCGLALNAKTDQQYAKVCGTHIGWWTADQICGSSINNVSPEVPFGAPLNCAETFSNTDGSTSTYTNLHICTEPAGASAPEQAQSCYSASAVSDCCGCATSASALSQYWPTALSPAFGGTDNGCYSNNPKWVEVVQPWLVFLKQACPTAYTYPFDDATSTFTCRGNADTVGPPSYDVTFFDTK